jgi:hypothetical protein
MPFALLPTALGVCFILVWVFIGGMIFRDNQFATQQEREADAGILQLPSSRRTHSTHAGRRMVRAAS